MKKFYLVFVLLTMALIGQAQLTGTKTIPGDYATIALAVADLNTQGVGAGGVTFNVLAAHTESSTDSILLTATGTAANPIIFQKSGVGANPSVSRTGTGVLTTTTLGAGGDAVIIIEGGDYISFDGINISTTDMGIEYGYYIRKVSGTDGSKNVTIKNAVITMTKGTSEFVIGIISSNNIRTSSLGSATGVTVSTTGGRHENLSFTGNTISNAFVGIYMRGYNHTSDPRDLYDQNNTVGAAGAGNTIQNIAGNIASTSYGIYGIYQNNWNTSYNTIANAAGGGSPATATFYGIFASTGTLSSYTANNNDVSVSSSSASAILNGIYNSAMTGNVVMENNTINLSNTVASTGAYAFLYNGGTSTAATSININNNNFAASTFNTTGTTYLIYNSNNYSATANISGNQNTGPINRTGATGTFYGYFNAASPTGVDNVFNNNFSNITIANTSSATFIGIHLNTVAAHTANVYNNVISNISTGSGSSVGINVFLANTRNIYNNVIHSITGTGIVTGITSTTGFTSGAIYRNKIYNLTSNATGTTSPYVNGILIVSGTSPLVHNNIIGELFAPLSAATDAVRGISSTSTTATSTVSIYFNTVYLNASSTGTNFGSSALYASTSTTATTATLDLKNNIFVNLSTPSGTGLSVAYRRSSTSLTNYGSSSNYNLFYAGAPSASRLIFYDGTNADQTLAAFKTRVTPREANSYSENPPFLSTTGSSPLFLHLNPAIATSIESGGTPVAGITTDFDGDTRNAATPDIGADEFSGTPLSLCQGTPSGTITGASSVCTGSATTLTISGGSSDLGLEYEWQFSSTAGGPYTPIPSATNVSYSTGALTSAGYYVVKITCTNSGLSFTTGEFAISINALPVISISPASPVVCLGSSVALTASGANTYIWSPSTNLNGTTTATVISTPTAPRTYTVTGTDVNSCVNTATVTVGLNPGITATATASATNICLNGTTQLNSSATSDYAATAIAHNPIPTPGSGVTTLAENGIVGTAFTSGNLDDGRWNNIAIPFSFKFYGNDYNAISISTNGYAAFGTLSVTQGFNVTLPNTATPNNAIHLITSDIDLRAPTAGTTTSSINYFVDGVAPNRKFVINFNEVRFFDVSATSGEDFNPGTATVQAILFEGTNEIEIHTTEISNTTVEKAQGIENSSGIFATVVPGRNNTTTWTGAPNAYKFSEVPYTYSWSPTTFLNNPLIANPVASNISTNTIYTVTVTDPVTGCSGTSSVTINVGAPLTLSTAVSSTNICNGSSVNISSTPGGGGLPYSYSWSNGSTVVSTDASFTASPTVNTTYTLTVTDNCGQVQTSAVTVNVTSHSVTATTPASRCGYGTVTLGATGSAGTTLNWYDVSTGGSPIATGTSYTTPAISVSKTYYVSASTAGTYFTGRLAPTATTATNLTNYGEVFTVTSAFTLNSVDVVSTTGTSITIALYNADGTTQLYTTSANTVPTNSTTAIPLNWYIEPGTYRLMVTGMTGSFIRENSGLTYPVTLTGVGQIDGFVSSLTGSLTTSASYYFLYNWLVTPGCSSARTAVTATVTTAPAVTLGATNSSICNGLSTTLSATSANTGYTYSWTPGPLSGSGVVVTPTATTKYYLNATDASGGANNGCVVIDSITINVLNNPQAITITPASPSVCAGGTAVALNASVGNGTGILGTGTTVNATNNYPAPYSQYYGGVKHQMLIRASELTAMGMQAGDIINNLTLTVNTVGTNFTGSLQDFQIDMGHTSATALNSSSFIGGLTNVLPAGTQTIPTTGLPQDVTHSLTTGFTWNGTDNVIIQTSFSNNITGTVDYAVQMPNTATSFVSTNWYRADGATSATVLAATSPSGSVSARVNMKLGYTNSQNIVWTPATGLFTDAAGTVAYTGTNLATVYARPATATTYTATLTTPNTCTSLATVMVNINVATSISTQPAAQSACTGGNATFTVTGAGTNLSYQWKKDGNDIAGATSASYTITGVTAGDAANYSVVVTGTCGAVTSNAVALTVNSGLVIGTQPVTQALCAGANASFTVVASGPGTITYQWKKNGSDIPGATAATYTITGVTAGDAADYSVVITSTCGSITSNVVALTLNAATSITTQPSVQNICAGANASFTVVGAGTGTLTYQWKKDGNDIAGANSATYTITGVAAANAGNYTVVVTGDCGSVTSNVAVLSLKSATVITTQPSALAACAGANASFTVVATGSGTLTYQWKKDGNDISGANSATYSLTGVAAADAANYSVVVTGDCGSVTSNAVALTINAATVIVTAPANQQVCAGANASFTVAATGTGTLTYQWKKGGTDISGATSSTYTITGVTATDAGTYSVAVTGTCGTVTSATATLTVNAATQITTQPSAQTVCAGANASFTVTASGTGTLTYQWRKNGADINGATSATYTITGVVAGDAGNYSVAVTGTCGTVTSNTVALTVNATTSITTQPTAVTTCLQQNATFTVVAAGTGTLTYQWRKDGNDIAGANSATYVVTNVIAASAGNYSVVVTGGCGSATSNNASLTVSGPCTSLPAVNEDVTSAVLLPNVVNNSTTLRVTALRSTRIQWNVVDMNGKIVMTFSNQVLAGKNDFQLRLAHLAGGNYYLVGTTEKGKVSTIRFIRM
jgi:hypothetical protein